MFSLYSSFYFWIAQANVQSKHSFLITPLCFLVVWNIFHSQMWMKIPSFLEKMRKKNPNPTFSCFVLWKKKKKELSSKISDKTLGCGHLTTGGEDSSTAILFNNETGSTIINHWRRCWKSVLVTPLHIYTAHQPVLEHQCLSLSVITKGDIDLPFQRNIVSRGNLLNSGKSRLMHSSQLENRLTQIIHCCVFLVASQHFQTLMWKAETNDPKHVF